jgi:hypothetical protein
MHRSLHRVFAGNRYEYAEYMRIFERSHNNTKYITNRAQLANLPKGYTVFCVGNFRQNKHFREIYEEIILRELQIVEVIFP